jgi:pyrroline-5-carboxylate reductase
MARGLEGRRIALVGAGAMGEALAAGLLRAGVAAQRLRAADPDPARRKALEEERGVRCGADAAEAVAEADLVILAVKPGVVAGVLEALAPLGPDLLVRPLWISIAAGVTLAELAAGLPRGARLVRAMPNTPALVGEGATAYVTNPEATSADRAAARALFESVGMAWEAPDESLLDAVTGLSGSGPAYVFVMLEALADAGVRMGLPRDAASALATQTVLGAAHLVRQSGRHPAALKDQVASPGGTTIAGLERLEARGFRAALFEAVAAATRRSRELGRG